MVMLPVLKLSPATMPYAGPVRRLLQNLFLWVSVLGVSACAGTPQGGPDVSLEALLESAPPPTLEEVELRLAAGQLEAARVGLQRILATDSENGKATLLLGETLLRLDQPQNALARFEEASATPDLLAWGLEGQGVALLHMRRPEAAIAALREAVTLDPSLWRAHNAMGVAHDRISEWGEAEQAYQTARELRPDSASVANNSGMSLMLQQRVDEAIPHFERALRREPDFDAARANLRVAYAMRGQYIEALAGVSPNHLAAALNNVGYIAMVQGDFEAAEAYLSRAMAASPAFNRVAAQNLEDVRQRREISTADAGRGLS